MLSLTVAQAVHRVKGLLRRRTGRVVIGITGQPGAGKSTVARCLQQSTPGSVVLGMDAFHLAHSALTERGLAERKGAIDTFDADGYVSLLHRVRQGSARTIWAPEFRREIEDAIAGAIAIEPRTPVVFTEGNYLLAEQPPWDQIPTLCDEVWYVDVPEDLRLRWLIQRHIDFGRSEEEARSRSGGSDATNAELIARTRQRANAMMIWPAKDIFRMSGTADNDSTA